MSAKARKVEASAPAVPRVRCPKARHGGSKVTRKGFHTDDKGRRWQRYQCQLADGSTHRFAVLLDDHGAASVSVIPPGRCEEHPDATVHRNGTYGGEPKRQRYKCVSADGSTHYFAMPMPRVHVAPATVKCSHCEEFVGVHHGAQAASRRSKWPMSAVVDALNELSLGVAYSKASLNMRAKFELAVAHAATHSDGQPVPEKKPPRLSATQKAKKAAREEAKRLKEEAARAFSGEDPFSDPPALTAPPTVVDVYTGEVIEFRESARDASWNAVQARNAWHAAADIADQYSPVLFAHVDAEHRKREQAQRAENDAVKAAGGTPTSPVIFVMDELPVFLRKGKGASRVAWTIHVVGEVIIRPGKTENDPPLRENRLRLARALPGPASASTWLLVLDEVGVVPDVVIADNGQAIAGSISHVYDGMDVAFVPSLFHFAQTMSAMFFETDGYFTRVNGKKAIHPDLKKHLGTLNRNSLVLMGGVGWKQWWDDLEQLAINIGAPPAPVIARRGTYFDVIDQALPLLAAQPLIPASNAGVEHSIRSQLKPIMRGRKQRYRNITRTNALLDLVVCADTGLFNNTELVAKLIRDDNLKFNGWATPLRAAGDTQPPALVDEEGDPRQPRYESLLDTSLVPVLLKDRQVTLAPSPKKPRGRDGVRLSRSEAQKARRARERAEKEHGEDGT